VSSLSVRSASEAEGGEVHAGDRLVDLATDPRREEVSARVDRDRRGRRVVTLELECEPRVVLADEPTGNLDTTTGAEIIELLANLGIEHGSTVIVATHDVTLSARAPRRIAMRDGTLAVPVHV
jgi:putative ABC transport system ATP-binding protein